MKYNVIKSDPYNDTLGQFVDKVNEYIEAGWIPKGGIVILTVNVEGHSSPVPQFLQTMVKE